MGYIMGVPQLLRQMVLDIRSNCMSNESEILAARVDEMQLLLLCRELCRWKVQHDDVN